MKTLLKAERQKARQLTECGPTSGLNKVTEQDQHHDRGAQSPHRKREPNDESSLEQKHEKVDQHAALGALADQRVDIVRQHASTRAGKDVHQPKDGAQHTRGRLREPEMRVEELADHVVDGQLQAKGTTVLDHQDQHGWVLELG